MNLLHRTVVFSLHTQQVYPLDRQTRHEARDAVSHRLKVPVCDLLQLANGSFQNRKRLDFDEFVSRAPSGGSVPYHKITHCAVGDGDTIFFCTPVQDEERRPWIIIGLGEAIYFTPFELTFGHAQMLRPADADPCSC